MDNDFPTTIGLDTERPTAYLKYKLVNCHVTSFDVNASAATADFDPDFATRS